jgi:hypothetical protein
MTAAPRPPSQRWIKRPPRPSRAGPQKQPARKGPGMSMFLLAIGFGIGAGLLGAVVGPQAIPDRPGMGGLFAGLGFGIGFFAFWRGIGGTRQDIRELFR